MENVLITNNKEYKLEKIWRKKKTDYSRDSKGNLFPFPVPPASASDWTDKKTFIERLTALDGYLDLKKKFELYESPMNCLICGKKNITTKRYVYDETMWEDGLIHYMDVHNIEPSIEFKQKIYHNHLFRQIKRINKMNESDKTKMILERVQKQNNDYVMIDRNQILILDALMIHGGYMKRYVDKQSEAVRYSEHAGLLDFDENILSKIVVSGSTTRVEAGDDEIYLPLDMEDMFEYEYIFHTHPPTPKPGGRASGGILYEFPSIGDIYHFIDHHNEGNVIGSLVVTAEGLYNIRKLSVDTKNIEVDDDKIYRNYYRRFNKVQKDAIAKYGTRFSTKKFYSKIAQNVSYISSMNKTLNKFNIHIDFYPRKQDRTGEWIIDTVFLVFRHNKPNTP